MNAYVNTYIKRAGVYVDQRDVTVVIVEGGEIIWSAMASLPVDGQASSHAHIAIALGGLLDRIPRSRWPALRVETALGAPWARVKVVKGVPPVSRHRELVSLLRLNTTRFVAATRPVIITGASMAVPGEARVGIADRSVVDAVTREIVGRGLRAGRIVPAASLESTANPPGSVADSSTDAENTGEILTRETVAIRVATRVATARGAMPLGLFPRDNPAAVVPDASRGRIVAAAAVLVAAGLVYLGNQWNIERSSLVQSQAAVRSIVAATDSGAHREAELRQMDLALMHVASFSHRRVSTALLLGAITQALPAEAAITTLRIDTADVDIVALSPRTAAVVDALSDIPNVAAPTIIGPVSRETVGPRELERATIRLRVVADYDRGKTAFEVDRDRYE